MTPQAKILKTQFHFIIKCQKKLPVCKQTYGSNRFLVNGRKDAGQPLILRRFRIEWDLLHRVIRVTTDPINRDLRWKTRAYRSHIWAHNNTALKIYHSSEPLWTWIQKERRNKGIFLNRNKGKNFLRIKGRRPRHVCHFHCKTHGET